MASMRDIKRRKSSISSTQQITKAMKLVSTVKLQKARAHAESTDPYFNYMYKTVSSMLAKSGNIDHPYLKQGESRRKAVVVITSNRGLAGGYNQNAIKMAEEFVDQSPNTLLFIVGEYGRTHFANRNVPYDTNFEFSAAIASMWEARRICLYILEFFNTGRVDDISIIYSDPEAGNGSECQLQCLLPLARSSFRPEEGVSEKASKEDWNTKEFYPDPNTVLDCIVPSYLAGYIYSSLIDSYFDEQEARMSAMSVAGKNAEDMIKQLKVEYNRVRQAKITREMVEIASGARALKKKRQMLQSEGHRLEQPNQ